MLFNYFWTIYSSIPIFSWTFKHIFCTQQTGSYTASYVVNPLYMVTYYYFCPNRTTLALFNVYCTAPVVGSITATWLLILFQNIKRLYSQLAASPSPPLHPSPPSSQHSSRITESLHKRRDQTYWIYFQFIVFSRKFVFVGQFVVITCWSNILNGSLIH